MHITDVDFAVCGIVNEIYLRYRVIEREKKI